MMQLHTRLVPHSVPLTGRWMGLDLSLTSSAIATIWEKELRTYRLATDKGRGLARIKWINDQVVRHVREFGPDGIALEGYSFGSTSHSHSLGELGGVVKMSLAAMGFTPVVVPPSSLKKFVTGKGQTDGKGPIMMGLLKRYGIEVPQNDECDATAVALFRAHMALAVPVSLSDKCREALKGAEFIQSPFPAVRHRERPAEDGDKKVATALQIA